VALLPVADAPAPPAVAVDPEVPRVDPSAEREPVAADAEAIRPFASTYDLSDVDAFPALPGALFEDCTHPITRTWL
jgi:hypothetical protein